MTNKINLVINMSILALLIYLSISVKTLQEKVFPDQNVMLGQIDKTSELEYNIKTFLNNALKEAITEQENQ